MRFHVAMDSLEKENWILRLFVVGLLLLSIGLCLSVVRVAQKPPLLIERGCISKSIAAQSADVTKDEVRRFVEEALKARFDTDGANTHVLSSDQQLARSKEQSELNRQHFRQTVLFNSADFKDDSTLIVDADRLISTASIRSAFRFPLLVQFARIDRSDANPYGLLLTDVKVIEEKKSDK